MKNKIIHQLSFIFMFLMGTGGVTFAQKTLGITALHTFLQKNADSTVVLSYLGTIIAPRAYVILSKKADTVTLYLYDSPYDKRALIPANIRQIFDKRDIKIMLEKVDVNAYFNAKYIDRKKAMELWRQLMLLKPWEIKQTYWPEDDCDVAVLDGFSTVIDLITKNEIRSVGFHEPKIAEANCPGNKSRQAVISISNLLDHYFKF